MPSAVFFLLAVFFAFAWNQERVNRKKREDKIPHNIKKIYWNI